MSKIKNDGLDQYGKVLSLNGIGGERVKQSDVLSLSSDCSLFRSQHTHCGSVVLKPRKTVAVGLQK